jgi:hypothetical protein
MDEGAVDDGELCWALEPADGLVSVFCAFAKLVPAISAAAATEIRKRLVMELLLEVLVARADNKEKSMKFLQIGSSIGFVF